MNRMNLKIAVWKVVFVEYREKSNDNLGELFTIASVSPTTNVEKVFEHWPEMCNLPNTKCCRMKGLRSRSWIYCINCDIFFMSNCLKINKFKYDFSQNMEPSIFDRKFIINYALYSNIVSIFLESRSIIFMTELKIKYKIIELSLLWVFLKSTHSIVWVLYRIE